MARFTDNDWALAKSMYEANKSFREIQGKTGIDASNIAKKAKKEGWTNDVLPRLIQETVRVKEEFTTLLPRQQDYVVKEVEERLRHLAFITNATHININRMMRKFDPKDQEYMPEMTVMDNKLIQSTIKDGRESLLGKEASQTNVQVNNAVSLESFLEHDR